MRKTALNLAMLATLAAFTTVVHADTRAVQASFKSVVTDIGITYSFTGLALDGTFAVALSTAGLDAVYGTLTSVSIDASLDATDGSTYASDLTLLVQVEGADEPLLQIGGTLSFGTLTGAAEQQHWGNGDSSSPGTTVIDTVTLGTPLSFSGTAADPDILLVNGWFDAATWSGTITLNGLSTTPLPVPEPASWAMFAAGAMGLVGWMGRRRRRAAEAL